MDEKLEILRDFLWYLEANAITLESSTADADITISIAGTPVKTAWLDEAGITQALEEIAHEEP